jgi:protein O-GlcNAc transferase
MIESTVRQYLSEALRRHHAGELREAEVLYRQVLSYQPAHSEALRLLGIVAFQTGRADAAVELIRRAIALSPNEPDYHINLGTVLASQGNDDEAISGFRRALALEPHRAEAYARLGITYLHKGETEQAISQYQRALELDPNSADTHFNLGVALHECGRLDEAIAAYRQTVSLRATFADAWHNLGAALRGTGRTDEAATALRHAVSLRPEHADTYPILGEVLSELGRVDEAISALEKAIALGSATSGTYNNLGVMFYMLGLLDEALAALRKAISLGDDPSTYLNLGNVLRDSGDLDDAIASYRKAADHGDPKAASNLLVAIYFHPAYDSRRILQEHQEWSRRHARPLSVLVRPHQNDRSPQRRLRIAYFSHCLGNRPIGRLLLPLLTHHDRKAFEVFCYCDVAQRDYMTDELRAHVDVWRDTGKLSDEALAELVCKDSIDVFVDLTMHMGGSRLLAFARKPAPVQLTYLAYCGTTGLDTIDYRLTDPHLDPPDRDASLYTEKSIRLPRTYWCIAAPREAPQVTPRDASRPITFGCFNSYFKVTRPTLEMWARVLAQAPASQMLIYSGRGAHRQRALELFSQAGVACGRVQFVEAASLEDYYRRHQLIDIALDPHPYPGGTLTMDALWMGVPVVTLAGESAHSRGGLSILSNIGLVDLVAQTPDQYVQIATTLAADSARLAELRAALRQRMLASPLMDAAGFAGEMEAAFRSMWTEWCRSSR